MSAMYRARTGTADAWQLDVYDCSVLMAIDDDLSPDTILTAYSRGLFPMPVEPGGPIGWWSPERRGVLEPGGIHISRSMNRVLKRFEIRVDTVFEEVIDRCADPTRPHGWIDHRIRSAYLELHRRGWCHSVEAWLDGHLAGGLYGLSIGGLFAGESMFHNETNGSKAALIGLAQGLIAGDSPGTDPADRLIDVQWSTDHLASMGITEISRRRYLLRLGSVLNTPPSAMFEP